MLSYVDCDGGDNTVEGVGRKGPRELLTHDAVIAPCTAEGDTPALLFV